MVRIARAFTAPAYRPFAPACETVKGAPAETQRMLPLAETAPLGLYSWIVLLVGLLSAAAWWVYEVR